MKQKQLTPEQKKEQKLLKLSKDYENANLELNLEGKNEIDQIHMLVDAGDALMFEICKLSDEIKITDLDKVKEITPLDKRTYLDFVNIAVKKNNDKLKEKAIMKFQADFNKRLFITNLRHSFLSSYMEGKDLKVTDYDSEEYVPFSDYVSDTFLEIMNDSAKKRDYLNNVLWKRYRTYSNAAEYLTKGELCYKDFKNLVDWQHYKEGGYPTEKTPSKIWSIFDKFNYAYRTLSKWGYDKTIKDLNYEFGLEIEETVPHKIEHSWLKEKEY